MPKYTKKQRKQRRRLHRVNIPLKGLKTAKSGYKAQVGDLKHVFKYRPSKNY